MGFGGGDGRGVAGDQRDGVGGVDHDAAQHDRADDADGDRRDVEQRREPLGHMAPRSSTSDVLDRALRHAEIKGYGPVWLALVKALPDSAHVLVYEASVSHASAGRLAAFCDHVRHVGGVIPVEQVGRPHAQPVVAVVADHVFRRLPANDLPCDAVDEELSPPVSDDAIPVRVGSSGPHKTSARRRPGFTVKALDNWGVRHADLPFSPAYHAGGTL